MGWSISGRFFENCSCDAICPCTWSNMSMTATHDYCRAALAFEIEQGDVDGVDVGGRTVVLVIETEPNMAAGNWKAGLVIDDGASGEQAEAIGRVMSGAAGGPPAALGPLISEFLGVEQHPLSIARDGSSHTVTIGESSYTGTPMATPTGDPVELTNIVVHPAGPSLQIAPANADISILGISWSGSDLSGFTSTFDWAA